MDPIRVVPQLVARHKELALALARAFPEADEETLADTLEGASDLPELLAALARSRMQDELLAEVLRKRIEEMRQRLERLQVRAEQKRGLIVGAMQETGLKKLVQADFTLSLRAGAPKLVVLDESLIPEEFWRPQPAKLDRSALLAAVKAGRFVAGAELGEPEPSLAVRRY